MAASLPQAFHAPVWLQRLNILAAASSLAACTAVVLTALGRLEGEIAIDDHVGAACGVSTFGYALVWARLFRARNRFLGWSLCVPLAALNAITAMLLLVPWEGLSDALGVAVASATFGALIWAPALMVTLFCFGLPIHIARRDAERGLSSEDRGERTVGVLAALLAAIALVWASDEVDGRLNVAIVVSLGSVAVACGVTSAVLAHLRERRRQHFVAAVRGGRAEGFRLEETARFSGVVRVAEVGHAYRGATFSERVVEFDDVGGTKSRLAP